MTIVRPQPLGVLPWPAGLLIIPDVEGSGDVVARILQGAIPDSWPPALEFVGQALHGDAAVAAQSLTGDDLISRYNKAVLVGGEGVWETLVEEADGDLAALVSLGTFTVGLADTPPRAEGLTGEVAAMVHSARASAALEIGDVSEAVDELTSAIVAAESVPSPILAAAMRLTKAELLRERMGDAAAANAELDAGLKALPHGCDPELKAEMHVARGMARHELGQQTPGYLLPAVNDYTEAAKTFREETHPEMFALVNQQLALAYLIMPMSSEGDRLRLGVAVNSLRAALRVYTKDSHPAAWITTQLNLANALQYLPSVHQEDNLDEAVHLYEEILQYRTEDADPLGYARILTNQANALGHLGVFSDATEKLAKAREIFSGCGHAEGVSAVDEILTSVRVAQEAS